MPSGNGEPLKLIGISRDISERKSIEKDREALIAKLKEAAEEKAQLLEEIKKLEGLLPVCSGCRRIRHNDNTWWPLEKYIEEHSSSQLTHTICPDCTKIYYQKE